MQGHLQISVAIRLSSAPMKKKKSYAGHLRNSGVVAIALAVALVMQSSLGIMHGSSARAGLVDFVPTFWLDIARWWQSQEVADGDGQGGERGPVACSAEQGICAWYADCPEGQRCEVWDVSSCECVWNTTDNCPQTWQNATLLPDAGDPEGCIAAGQSSGLCPENATDIVSNIKCGNSPDLKYCHYCRFGACPDGFECRQTGNDYCQNGSQAEAGGLCSDGTCYRCADVGCPADFDRCWTGEQPVCEFGQEPILIGQSCTVGVMGGRCIICPPDGGDRGASGAGEDALVDSNRDASDLYDLSDSGGDGIDCDPAIAGLNDEQRSALMDPGGATVGALLQALSRLSGDMTLEQVTQEMSACSAPASCGEIQDANQCRAGIGCPSGCNCGFNPYSGSACTCLDDSTGAVCRK